MLASILVLGWVYLVRRWVVISMFRFVLFLTRCTRTWRRGDMTRLCSGSLLFSVFVVTWTGCRPGVSLSVLVLRRCDLV